VISSIRIEAFRGVKEGQIDGLGPISILVGPNNSGKSTCLEAVAAVGLAGQVRALLKVLQHRGGSPHDSLAHVVSPHVPGSKFTASLPDGSSCTFSLRLAEVRNPVLAGRAREEGLDEPMLQIQGDLLRANSVNPADSRISIFVDKHGKVATPTLESGHKFAAFDCNFVDVATAYAFGALEEAYSTIAHVGKDQEVVRALAKSMTGLTDLRILKSNDDFILHAMFDNATPVPVYLVGDGSKRLIELAAAVLGVDPGGVVLLEEPECFQHPRYLREVARLLVEAAKAERQIILSTHSIELVDLLLEAAEKTDLDYPFVHRLRLVDGKLSGVVLHREQALASRQDLFEDLRA
jgi:energy-coupling factor transporter ATP-binding protein EcfA2